MLKHVQQQFHIIELYVLIILEKVYSFKIIHEKQGDFKF